MCQTVAKGLNKMCWNEDGKNVRFMVKQTLMREQSLIKPSVKY